jgi:hypothetical protein
LVLVEAEVAVRARDKQVVDLVENMVVELVGIQERMAQLILVAEVAVAGITALVAQVVQGL